MSDLRNLQEQFQNYLLNSDKEISHLVVRREDIDVEDRLDIYGFGYYLRFEEALADDFPIFKKLVGEEKFAELCEDYVSAYPSTHFSIRYLGKHLATFLKMLPKVDPLWVEMVKFEWALRNALDAPDDDYVTIEDMTRIPPESWSEVGFILHPSLAQLMLQSNVVVIWQALVADKRLPEFEQTEATIWIIWRKDRLSYFYALDEHATWMLNAVLEGETFGDICEGLTNWMSEEEAAQFAAGMLRNWIENKIISHITL